MDIDAKILNKILENWTQQHIKSTRHHDQVEFNPRIQGRFNIQKSTNIIHDPHKMKAKTQVITSIETVKAYDKFQHPFRI